ncbi:MAG: bifunctional hydroxymethylpyrimidine kinase/phosphomethylpyrimidine kinase [Pseudomonadota bacterium]
MIKNVLSIAGSDPSAGAGVQTDLKAIAANGAYGMAALTALTAQNTRGVKGVHLAPPDFVRDQILTVFEDVRVDAVKIGMIATADIAVAVAQALRDVRARNIVVDPVMVASSGDRLLAEDAVDAVRAELLPLAAAITPNLPEGAVLLEAAEPSNRAEMSAMATELLALGPAAVLLKGGHLTGAESPDVLATPNGQTWFEGARSPGRPIHGGGCTLSSTLATQLALKGEIVAATEAAKAYVAGAIAAADDLEVGSGARPLHHFHALWAQG